ncbi:glycosyltransferase [Deefgea piscis]|uniref:Glycosyltransferase n=1 Tax=Deefgea piscis TaxID=2739061 RepID=A0A6M8SQI4_9NEIS|nr:glycosyltransferase [Deefgea piscis]QKJ65566.1 glycosyltransferase [Deefgea piscis]
MSSLVSILVPCFNHSSFLIESLESFRIQTYSNLELHIIDDGSTDDSSVLIRSWVNKNSTRFVKCTFEKTVNKGVVNTLNSLLEKSDGQFIVICASDDILTPDSVAVRLAKFDEDDSVDVVFGRADVINNEGVSYFDDAAKILYKANVENFKSTKLISELFYRWSLPGPVSMYRKSSLLFVGSFDSKYQVEDRSLFLRMVMQHSKYLYVDQCVASYRRHDGAYTVNPQSRRRVQLDIAQCHVDYANQFSGLRYLYLKSFVLDVLVLKYSNYVSMFMLLGIKGLRKLIVLLCLFFYSYI